MKSFTKLTDLKPAPYNPRKIGKKELDGLGLSLQSFGDISGIVWNQRTGHLVAGHQRLAALKEQYGDELTIKGDSIITPKGDSFRVRTVDWDEPTEKIANIAANNPHIAGTFIQDDLDAIIAELGETEWASQIEPLNLDKLATPLEAIEDGVLDESQVELRAKLGDVWQCGNHRITCGDSTDEAVARRVLQNDKPFMMVTDPPYGVEYDATWRNEYDGFERHAVDPVSNDDKADWSSAFLLFSGDVAYVWHAGSKAVESCLAITKAGFMIRSQIIWSKKKFPFGRGHYHWNHEPCWYAARKGRTSKWCGDRKQSTTWEIQNINPMGGSDEQKTTHSTQKPVECMARPIRNHGEKGDYIYEPFSGSGTTLIACEQLERRCLAIELEPRYVDMAMARWEKLTGGKAERITAGE